MMIKTLVIIGLIIAGIYSQDTILNTCANTQLGNTAPTKKEDCWQDKPFANVNCCFIQVTNVETPFNYCGPLDIGVKDSVIKDAVINIFPPAFVEVECSASITAINIMMMVILSILFV